MSYFDDAGTIREELLDAKAEEQAKEFVKYSRQGDRVDRRNSLSSAQLRRFFSEFRQLEKRVNTVGFDKVKPLIKMVKSKANYSANPSNPKIPKSFKDFLVSNIDDINSGQDFEAFMLHFEAVVGFFYGIEGVGSS